MLHCIIQACVHLSLNHLWRWRLHSLSGHHPIFWLPSLFNVFLPYTHVSCVVVAFIASHHPSPLIKLLQKAVRFPQSQPCSRLASPHPPVSPYRARASVSESWGLPLNSLQLINIFPALQTKTGQLWSQKLQKERRNHVPRLAYG